VNRDVMSGMFWLCLGVGLCVWSLAYPLGVLTQPGSGLLPLMLGAIVAFFSLVLIFTSLGSVRSAERSSPLFTEGWKRVVAVIAVLLVAGVLFEKLGYLITFFFLPLILMILAGVRSWKQIALIAFGTAFGVYICFVLLLKQPLPAGLLAM